MNKFFFIGNLTKDPELTYTAEGKAKTLISIAVSGMKKDEPDFFNCTIWNAPAENTAKYCAKGSKVHLEGSINNYSYEDKDGNKKYGTNYNVQNIEFLNSKTREDNGSDERSEKKFNDNKVNKKKSKEEEYNDDIPF